MRLIYRPIGIIVSLAGMFASKAVFNWLWGKFDDEEAPKATIEGSGWTKVLVAAAAQGLIAQTVRAAINRGGAEGFQWLTGVWPGEKQPDPE
jgi:Protein of unknown function (DUF4235)